MKPHGERHWSELAYRVVVHPIKALEKVAGRLYQAEESALFGLINQRFFMPGGRYLYACGNGLHQVQNCLLLRCEDTREGWADLSWKAEMSLLTGAGIGVYWGDVRSNGTPIRRTGGVASGPVPKAITTNELGRSAVQGGSRRSAIWGGLPWWHADVFTWIKAKDWPDYIKAAKAEDPSIPAPLDMTNISVCLDDEFFFWFEHEMDYLGRQTNGSTFAPDGSTWHEWAQRVYWACIDRMTQTGEPGFSVDLGDRRDEKLRNACTEIVSADDSDVCNLGGLVLPRFEDPRHFGEAVRLGTLYLTAGTVYSDLPYDKVGEIREKNRRLGLDVLGVHEFCLQRGVRYGSDEALEVLEPYMREYERATEYAWDWQDQAGLSRSVATRSGAPTGTRAIAAETTTGWEPVSAAAYKRTVIESTTRGSDKRVVHYVVDPTVARLVRERVIGEHDEVEDSFSLAEDYERRFRMQAYAQSHTDQAISMTINLPHVMKDPQERRTFGDTLYRYLPKLRGITVYPNGAIAGQPIVPVSLAEALNGADVSVEESEDKCASGVCGI
jgi:ribonucleoside-diphosphate reductase alpha chain